MSAVIWDHPYLPLPHINVPGSTARGLDFCPRQRSRMSRTVSVNRLVGGGDAFNRPQYTSDGVN